MELIVEKMSCQHCVRAVTAALRRLDSAAAVEVDLGSGRVRATGTFDVPQAIAALAEDGYPARPA